MLYSWRWNTDGQYGHLLICSGCLSHAEHGYNDLLRCDAELVGFC